MIYPFPACTPRIADDTLGPAGGSLEHEVRSASQTISRLRALLVEAQEQARQYGEAFGYAERERLRLEAVVEGLRLQARRTEKTEESENARHI